MVRHPLRGIFWCSLGREVTKDTSKLRGKEQTFPPLSCWCHGEYELSGFLSGNLLDLRLHFCQK